LKHGRGLLQGLGRPRDRSVPNNPIPSLTPRNPPPPHPPGSDPIVRSNPPRRPTDYVTKCRVLLVGSGAHDFVATIFPSLPQIQKNRFVFVHSAYPPLPADGVASTLDVNFAAAFAPSQAVAATSHEFILAPATLSSGGAAVGEGSTARVVAELRATMRSQRDSLREIFARIDANKDNKITKREFKRAAKELKLKLTDDDIDGFFKEIDISEDGAIDLNEFIDAFSADAATPSFDPTAVMSALAKSVDAVVIFLTPSSLGINVAETYALQTLARAKKSFFFITQKADSRWTSAESDEQLRRARRFASAKFDGAEAKDFLVGNRASVAGVRAAVESALPPKTFLSTLERYLKNSNLTEPQVRALQDARRSMGGDRPSQDIAAALAQAVGGVGSRSVSRESSFRSEGVRSEGSRPQGLLAVVSDLYATRDGLADAARAARVTLPPPPRGGDGNNVLLISGHKQAAALHLLSNATRGLPSPRGDTEGSFVYFSEGGGGSEPLPDALRRSSLRVATVAAREMASARVLVAPSIQGAPPRPTEIDRAMEAIRAAVQKGGRGSLDEAFKKIDANGDGKLTVREFNRAMADLRAEVDPKDVRAVFSTVDVNEEGCIFYDEFIEAFKSTSVKLGAELEDAMRAAADAADKIVVLVNPKGLRWGGGGGPPPPLRSQPQVQLTRAGALRRALRPSRP
jgi:Ca2+-binding EF-hand superfamily protein